MDGLKTGYIRASGFNLAASAERRGVRLIGVVFGGKSPRWRDNHMADLLDRSFEVAIAEAEAADIPVPKRKPDVPGESQVAAVVPESAEQWAIQVGAFERYAPAHLAVTRAARAVPSLLRSKVAIVPDEGEDGKVYRARMVGLTEASARGSCAQLQKRNIACIVVPAETSLAQGSQ
jgi:D-alanyl-D-alanine carboxypeptidase